MKLIDAVAHREHSAAEPQPKERKKDSHRRGTEVTELGVLLDKILFSAYSASPR
jgi:hypothetical protein